MVNLNFPVMFTMDGGILLKLDIKKLHSFVSRLKPHFQPKGCKKDVGLHLVCLKERLPGKSSIEA